MKNQFLVLVCLFTGVASSAQAKVFFDGNWSSTTGTTTLYADQTVNYDQCKVSLQVTSTTDAKLNQKIKIQKLQSQCSSPTYWIFDQVLSAPTELTIDAQGAVSFEKLNVGTLNEAGLSAKYDDGDDTIFLNITQTTSGVHVEWSVRSFDDVNFDVISDLSSAAK